MTASVDDLLDDLARLMRESKSVKAKIGWTRHRLRELGMSGGEIARAVKGRSPAERPVAPVVEEPDWLALRAEHMARRVPELLLEMYGSVSPDDPSAVPTAESVAVAEWHEMFGSAGLPPVDEPEPVAALGEDWRDLGLG